MKTTWKWSIQKDTVWSQETDRALGLVLLHHSLPFSELLQLSWFRFTLLKKKRIGEDKEIANDVLFSLDCDLENAWINYQFFFRLEKIYIQI